MRVANVEAARPRGADLQAATGCDEQTARAALAAADDDIAVAVVMLARDATATAARAKLDAAGGNLRRALDASSPAR